MAERYGRPIDPAPLNPAPAATYEAAPDDEILASQPTSLSSALHSGSATTVERIGNEVQKAQEQLLNLRRQQEQIERQKRDLEELSRKQEELESGRTEMTEKLARALVVVERQANESQKRVEQLRATNESFTHHLAALESIDPKSWASVDMQRELSRALGIVDHAKTDYMQQKARFTAEAKEAPLAPGNPVESARAGGLLGGGAEHDFRYWLKAGVAFTLPIIVLGFLGVILFAWFIATYAGTGAAH